MRALVLVAVALLATGCSGSPGTPKPTASNSGVVPPSLTASPAAAQQRRFGQSAEVAFVPNAKRATTLAVTVTVVRTGRLRDLAAYDLNAQAKASRPVYVRVSVTNRGPGDVGDSPLPVAVQTSQHEFVAASTFSPPFARCRSTPLPTPFAGGATTHTCLTFLVPRGETIVGVSDRSASGAVVATWKGTVKPPRKR